MIIKHIIVISIQILVGHSFYIIQYCHLFKI